MRLTEEDMQERREAKIQTAFRHLYQADKKFVLFSYESKLYFLRHNIKLDRLQQNMLLRSFRGLCLAALDNPP